VGTIVRGIDGGWRVSLDADASPIDDVQILLFKDFSQLVNEQALAPKDLPTAMTDEPSQSILGAAPAAPVPATTPAAGASSAAKPAIRAGAGHRGHSGKPAHHPSAAAASR
jgi:rod shape-determining protein MreC